VRSRASRVATILGSALALAGWTLPALAADAPSAAETAAARAAVVEAKLTPAQKQAVASFRAQYDKNVTTVRAQAPAKAGVRKAQIGDQSLQVAVAKRNPDGTLAVTCVDDAGQFAEFLAETKAPAKSENKEQ
jgi:hypothetical protein